MVNCVVAKQQYVVITTLKVNSTQKRNVIKY